MAKSALDKTPVGQFLPTNMNLGGQKTHDKPDGNCSSGLFSGHQHQFKSGEGSIKKWCGQDYKQIRSDCKRRGILFEDPEFPASNHLLVDDNSQFIISYFGRTRFDQNSIEWLRPHVSKKRIKN